MLFDSINDNSQPSIAHEVEAPIFTPAVPFVTFGLIGINLIVFVAMMMSGVSPMQPQTSQMILWGADFGPLTISGQWWRLLTSCFLHFGIIHIAMNMFVLFQVGPFTEKLFGNLRFLVLYLTAGVGGALLGLYIHPISVAAGASGAVFGVYGGLLAFLLVQRNVIRPEAAAGIAKSAAIFLVYNLIYGLSSPETDLVAHGGGLVVGFLAGCGLALPLFPPNRAKGAVRALLVGGVAVSIGVLAALHLSKRDGTSQNDWNRLVMTAPRITNDKSGTLVYSGTPTRTEAQRVAQALAKAGLLRSPGVTVLWNKVTGSNTLSVPMKGDETLSPTFDNFSSKLVNGQTVVTHSMEKRPPLPWDDPNTIHSIQIIGAQVASAAGGMPFSMRLLNSKGELKREVPITTTEVAEGLDRVTYSGQATAANAEALAKELQGIGFFKNLGTHVLLEKTPDGTILSFLLKDAALNDARAITDFTRITRLAAPSVGGLPIKLRLVDKELQVHKEINVQ